MSDRDRPRVLVLGPTPPPVHGTAMYTASLVTSPIVQERLDIVHLDTSDRRTLDNTGRFEIGNVLLGLRHLAQLVGALARQRPDIVYLPISPNAPAFLRDALFILAARVFGARVVTHLHGSQMRAFLAGASTPTRLLVRWTHKLVHRAWVHADEFRDQYDSLLSADRIRAIPNGVPDRFGDGVSRSSLGGRELRVLHLGQLGRNKGVDVLLDAVRSFRGRGADVRLRLAGPWRSEDDRRALEPVIEEMEREGAVTRSGPIFDDEKDLAFREADVFVLVTPHPFTEGQPLAVLEAMSASLPVVATARASVPEMVEHEVTGFLVPDGAAEAVADALEALIAEPDRAPAMGRAGRHRYLDRFTAERTLALAARELEAHSDA